MAGARTGECVRDLVQQDLVNAVVVETLGEMARDRDALLAEIAESGTARCVVEAEAPARVEVQCEQSVSPASHAVKITHPAIVRR